jgi:hypothetical protein
MEYKAVSLLSFNARCSCCGALKALIPLTFEMVGWFLAFVGACILEEARDISLGGRNYLSLYWLDLPFSYVRLGSLSFFPSR